MAVPVLYNPHIFLKLPLVDFGFSQILSHIDMQVVMVNSSWTKKHIRQLWWKLSDAKRVFPPCNTKTLQSLPLERRLKRLYLVSVAQFRPEKDHGLQLESLALARNNARRSSDSSGKSHVEQSMS